MSPTISFDERRRVLGRLGNNLVQKSGPLTSSERQQLSKLHAEMDQLEEAIQTDAMRKYSRAFRSYLRNSVHPTRHSRGLNSEERAALELRDMGVGTPTGGAYPGASTGFFAPLDFADQVYSAAREVGPMLSTSTVFTTTTGRITGYPEDNDTTVSGERITENMQVSEIDLNIAQTLLSSYKYSSRAVKVSIELAQDTGFPLDDYLARRLGIRLGRILNTELTLGTGANVMPNGLLGAATVGATAVGSSPDDGSAAGTNTIGSADLESLVESVDSIYKASPGVGFQMHSSTLSSIKALRDKSGRPLKLWKSAREAQSPVDLLMGYPAFPNPNMPVLQSTPSSPAVSIKSALFGALDRYIVRKTPLMVLRLEEKYIEYGNLAWVCFVRADGALIDGGGGAVKALQNTY